LNNRIHGIRDQIQKKTKIQKKEDLFQVKIFGGKPVSDFVSWYQNSCIHKDKGQCQLCKDCSRIHHDYTQITKYEDVLEYLKEFTEKDKLLILSDESMFAEDQQEVEIDSYTINRLLFLLTDLFAIKKISIIVELLDAETEEIMSNIQTQWGLNQNVIRFVGNQLISKLICMNLTDYRRSQVIFNLINTGGYDLDIITIGELNIRFSDTILACYDANNRQIPIGYIVKNQITEAEKYKRGIFLNPSGIDKERILIQGDELIVIKKNQIMV